MSGSDADFAAALTAALGAGQVLEGSAVAERNPGFGASNLRAGILVRPRDTAGVAATLRLCHEAGRAVVAQGGLTGLAGGATTGPGDVILSLERLDRIEAIDPVNRTMTVGAGCHLQVVQEAAEAAGLMFPLDLPSRGSCTVGGNIATNAGGCRVFRYGMTRGLVLGLEAVLADGTVLSSLNRVIKNNAGYDLKQLFIGTEGTLGIVTRAVLRLFELPRGQATALAAVESFEQVASLLKAVDGGLGGALSTFEVMWRNYYAVTAEATCGASMPLPAKAPFVVLIEALDRSDEAARGALEGALGQAFEAGLLADAVVAKSAAESEVFWRIRDDSLVLFDRHETVLPFDISLPIPEMADYVTTVEATLARTLPDYATYTFGHIADGNLHFAVCGRAMDPATRETAERAVYAPLDGRGSVSAEHGIGLDKKGWLPLSRNPEELALMRRLKVALDPKNILNPGKVVDAA
ncbi:putative FAD-linked oxidoreductase [Oceanibacterium hippocampi]|uniref:Putative FAD-linked oxidoreductase n=1 Tax=Oceanibacterium hippocampi TaxID=745714 RepID=A0A1Y5S3U5_9PROT|nr:FAD-binding oxidoreductase [Oceanibacterium hippocampi]SLN31034.1 putative FAD-linked oxidoreductase [Oceanibacterium hippocampi]